MQCDAIAMRLEVRAALFFLCSGSCAWRKSVFPVLVHDRHYNVQFEADRSEWNDTITRNP
jgi:hypothetical protein